MLCQVIYFCCTPEFHICAARLRPWSSLMAEAGKGLRLPEVTWGQSLKMGRRMGPQEQIELEAAHWDRDMARAVLGLG